MLLLSQSPSIVFMALILALFLRSSSAQTSTTGNATVETSTDPATAEPQTTTDLNSDNATTTPSAETTTAPDATVEVTSASTATNLITTTDTPVIITGSNRTGSNGRRQGHKQIGAGGNQGRRGGNQASGHGSGRSNELDVEHSEGGSQIVGKHGNAGKLGSVHETGKSNKKFDGEHESSRGGKGGSNTGRGSKTAGRFGGEHGPVNEGFGLGSFSSFSSGHGAKSAGAFSQGNEHGSESESISGYQSGRSGRGQIVGGSPALVGNGERNINRNIGKPTDNGETEGASRAGRFSRRN